MRLRERARRGRVPVRAQGALLCCNWTLGPQTGLYRDPETV